MSGNEPVSTESDAAVPAGPVEVRLQEGGQDYVLWLPHAGTDYIQQRIARERRPYELDMLRDMAERLSPGDLVLDIGANVGNHALYLAAVSRARVVAFEPQQEMVEALRESVRRNELAEGRIRIETVALGKAESSGHFTCDSPENRGARAVETGKGDLRIVPLSSYTFDQPVAMIKLDVEGMEPEVLEGAQALIDQDHPILYVESQEAADFEKVHAWLERRGYFYWDTFNATPTHLFLHETALGPRRIQERILYKQAQAEYGLRAQLERFRKQLNEANKKYRASNERIADLKEKLEQANEKYRQASGDLQKRKEQAGELEKRCAEAEGRAGSLEEALQARGPEAEQLRQLVETERAALEAANQELRELEGRETETRNRLQMRESALESAKEEIRALQDREAETRTRLETLQTELSQTEASRFSAEEVKAGLKEEVERLQANEQVLVRQLEEAKTKYRHVTGEEIPKLREKLEESAGRNRELSEERSRLGGELAVVRERAQRAEAQLARLRDSRTYRLGYHVREAVRSWRGVTRLPFALLRLLREPQAGQRKLNPASFEPSPVDSGRVAEARAEVPRALAPTESLARKVQADGVQRLRVACVMDHFNYVSFAPECDLVELTPDHWRDELEAAPPDMLLFESAWRGKDGLWDQKVGHVSEEVRGILGWCHERGIRTVFWSTEDPPHFATFLNTARLFEYVFTTDIDCIHRYKAALGHDRVYLLPFACQPAVHNPVEKYDRKDALCFAGAYYVRYPDRARDLETFVSELPRFRPLDIYDRNYGKDDPNYAFPEMYQPYIRGTLPFEEIDRAYKGYRFAINLNSVKQSQSMFARRVYELLVSNTLTISNYSRGVRLLFGGLVLASDSGQQMAQRLQALDESGQIDRVRLAALRKVLREHTYGHRLRYIVEKVTGTPLPDPLPGFRLLGRVTNMDELERMLARAERQEGVSLSLTLVLDGDLTANEARHRVDDAWVDVTLLAADDAAAQSLAELVEPDEWLAALHAEDYYGPHYLLDIALATRYTAAAVIGKAAHHRWNPDREVIDLVQPEQSYQTAEVLQARRSAIAPQAIPQGQALDWLRQLTSQTLSADDAFAIDPYNYCASADRAEEAIVTDAVDDLELDTGLNLATLQAQAEAIKPLAEGDDAAPHLDGQNLAALLTGRPFQFRTSTGASPNVEDAHPIRLSRNKAIQARLADNALELASTLGDGNHEYLYAPRDIPLDELARLCPDVETRTLPLHLEMDPGLNLSAVILFLDAAGNRIGHTIQPANRNHTLQLPDGTAFLRLGLRVYASGEARIRRLLLGHRDLEPALLLGQSDVLLLTNHYPSYGDLYRNGFVHTRVRAYQERGVKVDVYRLRKEQPVSWHEFQNVDVTTGSQDALRRMLASGRYRHVLVHFLDPDMWDVLKDFIDQIRVTVWVHGAEIHPWYRRKFNIETEEQEQKAREQSDARMAFWRGVLNPMPPKLHLVFVSRTFSEEVMEDLGFRLPEDQYSIIHNPIDTELFQYRPKPPEQRKKILSIRPFASRQYANDQTVAAILELSTRPGFEDLEFRIIGDGPLFEETVAAIRDLPNVTVEQRFLTQPEIAALHRDYGVFLCPTRWDSQGVSRDEAMASGLVPVTNEVAAIPEFVDHTCAMLAPADDATGLVAGIEAMIREPALFARVSGSAADRVHRQRSVRIGVEEEVKLLRDQVST